MTHDPMHPAENNCATRASLWRQDTLWNAMPVARGQREAALPDARRRPGVGGPKGRRNGNTSTAATPLRRSPRGGR
jgi:hypothetical protein